MINESTKQLMKYKPGEYTIPPKAFARNNSTSYSPRSRVGDNSSPRPISTKTGEVSSPIRFGGSGLKNSSREEPQTKTANKIKHTVRKKLSKIEEGNQQRERESRENKERPRVRKAATSTTNDYEEEVELTLPDVKPSPKVAKVARLDVKNEKAK